MVLSIKATAVLPIPPNRKNRRNFPNGDVLLEIPIDNTKPTYSALLMDDKSVDSSVSMDDLSELAFHMEMESLWSGTILDSQLRTPLLSETNVTSSSFNHLSLKCVQKQEKNLSCLSLRVGQSTKQSSLDVKHQDIRAGAGADTYQVKHSLLF